MSERAPTLASILNRLKESWAASVRVALPARVERFDSALQLVDVKPLIKEQAETESGEVDSYSLPVVTNVPLLFPGASGFRMTFPVAQGDTVLLVFADRSLDAWLDQGNESAPADTRRHHLTDAVAIPGLHSNKAPWSGLDSAAITLGSDAGAAEWAATATRTLTELEKIRTALNNFVSVFNAHTHAVTSAPGTTAVPSGSASSLSALTSPASSTVKIKG